MGTTRTFLPPLPPTLPVRGEETFHFMLGAKDAEMDEIENVLQGERIGYEYAKHGGFRVTPRTCYQADPVTVEKDTTLVLVECEPREITSKTRLIDHHRPGDPGFGLPPSQFWEASSIGQVYATLGKKEPSELHLIIAARDHCRFDAQKGLCPGIQPIKVKKLGRKHVTEELGVSKQKLEGTITRMKRLIRASSCIAMGGQQVHDLTGLKVPMINSLEYLAIYEALADLGGAAIVKTRNREGECDKIHLMGYTVRETVTHFKTVWAPSIGLQEIYGCEVRGYAGGYYQEAEIARAKAA